MFLIGWESALLRFSDVGHKVSGALTPGACAETRGDARDGSVTLKDDLLQLPGTWLVGSMLPKPPPLG